MTLENIVLQRLDDWRPDTSDRQTLEVIDPETKWAAFLAIEKNDALSAALWEMSVRAPAPPAEADLSLKAWADKVAAGVRSLLDPLAVLEIDAQRDLVLLRSRELTKRKGGRFYYEVLLTGTGQAEVRRYRAATDSQRRRQVPFSLTHEAVAKLAEDLKF